MPSVNKRVMEVRTRIGCVSKLLVISPHALDRISQRFGWNRREIQEMAKEVCRIYHKQHFGAKAEISLMNSVWVVKRVGKGAAMVKTVMPDSTNYAMREFL
jgi:hypothetical protein